MKNIWVVCIEWSCVAQLPGHQWLCPGFDSLVYKASFFSSTHYDVDRVKTSVVLYIIHGSVWLLLSPGSQGHIYTYIHESHKDIYHAETLLIIL